MFQFIQANSGASYPLPRYVDYNASSGILSYQNEVSHSRSSSSYPFGKNTLADNDDEFLRDLMGDDYVNRGKAAESIAYGAAQISDAVDILVTPDKSDLAAIAAGGLFGLIANRANKLRKALKAVEKGADLRLVRKAQAELAEALGYSRRIPAQKVPFNSHGQPVFFDGKNYITPDVDGHNVTAGWKIFDRKGRRVGTWNAEMTELVGN